MGDLVVTPQAANMPLLSDRTQWWRDRVCLSERGS